MNEVDRASRPARSRGVVALWAGQLAVAMGDASFLPCVGWLASEVTGERDRVGHVIAAATVPVLLFAPWAGVWADRVRRKRLLVASAALRAGLLVAFVAAAGSGLPISFASLLGLAFLLGTFATPFVPARDALLPTLVEGRRLATWNAAIHGSSTTAMLLGLVVGGVLLASGVGGADATDRVLFVLAANGVVYAVAAIVLARIGEPARERTAAATHSMWRDLSGGLDEARRNPRVGALLVLTAVNNLALMGPALVGPVLLLKDELRLPPQHLAWFEAAMALGMLIGALAFARFGHDLPFGRLLMVALVLDGATYLPFVWLDGYAALVATILVHGLFIPVIVIVRTTLLQAEVPEERRGQVFALVHVTVTGMTALSCLGAGWLAEHFGVRALFAVTGVLATVSGIVGWAWLARDLDLAHAGRRLEGSA